MDQIPQVKLHNYAFHNNGDLTFSDVTNDWGLTMPSFSNGAAYADFDNDGAMDMVINNINDEAYFIEILHAIKTQLATHFLQIKFKGDDKILMDLGLLQQFITIMDKQQVYENNPYRGYLSTVQNIAHFGLGKITMVDSVVIRWSNEKKQTIKNVKADQVLKVNIADATESYSWQQPISRRKHIV